MYLKGSAHDEDKDKIKEDYQNKFEFYEKKKKILSLQYEKSVSTI